MPVDVDIASAIMCRVKEFGGTGGGRLKDTVQSWHYGLNPQHDKIETSFTCF